MIPLAFSNPGFPLSLFGLPFLLMAIAIAGQTYYTAKRGYVYCGRAETVEKMKSPLKYRFFFGVQVAFVLLFIGFSTFPFWL